MGCMEVSSIHALVVTCSRPIISAAVFVISRYVIGIAIICLHVYRCKGYGFRQPSDCNVDVFNLKVLVLSSGLIII
jgi:hypothetical protein